MSARIPIFLSAPTHLSEAQQATYRAICGMLENFDLEPRALGRSDYPNDYPLKEVLLIARGCYGGMILGFTQAVAKDAVFKPETPQASKPSPARFPTPWNNLEAGLLFGLRVPLMVFREDGVRGGIFDEGVSDVFLQRLPVGGFTEEEAKAVRRSIQTWAGKVSEKYREF